MKRPLKANASLDEILDYRDALLQKSGFKDSEDRQGRLKEWSGSLFKIGDSGDILEPLTSLSGRSKVWKESQAEYYRLAAQFLFEKEFPSRLHKKVWACHVRGMTKRGIAEQLGMAESTVQRRIMFLRKRFFPYVDSAARKENEG